MLKEFLVNDRSYQICTNCVMDTSDPNITFNENGVCDHCIDFYNNVFPRWHPNEIGRKKLLKIINKIKKEGKKKDFDCILGISGGADSSYMLHLVVTEFGLRPLVFHVDGGWNSEIAVNNIEVIVDKLNLDLFTEVIDWEEMRDLQLAFFKSGVPHIDIPQDHAFVATMYKFANKYNVKYILNGGNISTECVRNPLDWIYYGTDIPHIKDIHGQFGTIELNNYPFSSIVNHKIYLRYIKRIKVIRPLDMLPYNKAEATGLLSGKYGWKHYPQKHFESRFTKFYEGYWLPVKFGYDTRRVQFSSLILTKQMTRDQAIKKLKEPSYDVNSIQVEIKYVANKLNISVEELKSYMEIPNKSYKDYKNSNKMFVLGAKILKYVGAEKAIKR